MDYVVGSVAALISGNVTPNRPKIVRRALTPTKHQPSPNVTPKSEFVEDRSIFLSPTQQKKKAIVKKSPKRIFQNADLDATDDCEGNSVLNSPMAEKVKKHLKEELDANDMVVKKSSASKSSSELEKGRKTVSPIKKSKMSNVSPVVDSSPKKKKKSRNSELNFSETKSIEADNDNSTSEFKSDIIDSKVTPSKKQNKSVTAFQIGAMEPANTRSPNKQETTLENKSSKETSATLLNNKKIKKSKKHKKKNKVDPNIDFEILENQENIQNVTEQNDKKRKKNKINQDEHIDLSGNVENIQNITDENQKKKKKNKIKQNKRIDQSKNHKINQNLTEKIKMKKKKNHRNKTQQEQEISQIQDETNINDKSDSDLEEVKSKNIPNPNAVTEKDSDSEHDSDNEIHSENEQENENVLTSQNEPEPSSDEEEDSSSKKKEQHNQRDKETVMTEDEIKRTLFIGNVPFSSKCKKEIKKIFSKYGQIDTIRIRTIPVKDARVTPKLAIIKNELHPERSTVNVYVKYSHPVSVRKALAENNTVLGGCHLRVSPSESTGAEHDPRYAVFVGNVPFGAEDDTLRNTFIRCGEIASVRIIRDKNTNAGKGFGYVNFVSKDAVELALAMSEEDLTIKNRILRVKRCTQRPGGGKPGQGGKGGNYGQSRGKWGSQGQGGGKWGSQGQGGGKWGSQGQGKPWGNRQGGYSSEPRQGENFGGSRQSDNRGVPGEGSGKWGNQGQARIDGAARRLMNKRKHQEGASNDAPPSKIHKNMNQPIKEKKQKKEFVGVTAEKKKKQKFDKGQKKKKALSEILTKKS